MQNDTSGQEMADRLAEAQAAYEACKEAKTARQAYVKAARDLGWTPYRIAKALTKGARGDVDPGTVNAILASSSTRD